MQQVKAIPIAEPLYEQVHRILRGRIMSGDWKPKSLLPGEVILSQELGVSVGTVRKAMDQLARENLVFRERGRGTFVKGDDEWQCAAGFKLFDLNGRPISPSIILQDVVVDTATTTEARLLKLRASAGPQVLRISRRWRAADVTINSEVIAAPLERTGDILKQLENGKEEADLAYAATVADLIERVVWFISEPGEDFGSIAAIRAHREANGATLRMSRLGLDSRGHPIELVQHVTHIGECVVQLNQ